MTPSEFEAEVIELFRMHGYEVIPQLSVSAHRPDGFIVHRPGIGKPHRILLECKRYLKDKIGPDDFNRFLTLVNNARNERSADSGIMVSIHGCTPSVIAVTNRPNCPVLVMSIDDLRNQIFNPRAYLTLACAEWKRDNFLFVGRAGHRRADPSRTIDLRRVLYDNATNHRSGFLVLFGGAGSGKTTQLIQLAIDLAEAYLRKGKGVIPLYIPLLRLSGGRETLEHYIFEMLRVHYPDPTPKWTFLHQQIAKCRIALLLDGLDEMHSLHKSKAVLAELVRIINSTGEDAKIILTCRSTMFETEEEGDEVFQTRLQRRFPDLTPEILELHDFESADLEDYIERAGAQSIRADLLGNATADLCKRPILLTFLIDIFRRRAGKHIPLTEEEIIDDSIVFMLENKIETHESSLDITEWRRLLEFCALKMACEGQMSLPKGSLTEIVRIHFDKEVTESDLRPLTTHARIRTLFDLQKDGITFHHLMFRDFLAAFGLARRLLEADGEAEMLAGKWMSPEILSYLSFALTKVAEEVGHQTARAPTGPHGTPLPRSKWCWVAPGLFVVGRARDSNIKGARLEYFKRGFWITSTPITIGDAGRFREPDVNKDTNYPSRQRSPLTNLTHEEASEMARRLGGRLPLEEEWERAASWVDGSYPQREQIAKVEPSSGSPPTVALAKANPWGFFDATGCVWQWTDTIDRSTGRYLVKGAFWGAEESAKLDPTERLVPAKPFHQRTGFRVVIDQERGQ